MNLRIWMVGIGLLCACTESYTGNLIFNSGFELGDAGWDFHSYQRPLGKNVKQPLANVEIQEGNAASGQRSYCIKRSENLSQTQVTSHNFLVKAGGEYTFSFYAKSNIANTPLSYTVFSVQRALRRDKSGNALPDIAFGQCGYDKVHLVDAKRIRLSTEWKRYFLTFRPAQWHFAYSLLFTVGGGKNGDVMIDDVQVEEAPAATAYAPAYPLEVAVKMDDYLYADPQKVTGRLSAVSYGRDCKKDINISMDNTYNGRTHSKKTVILDLKKDQIQEIPLVFNGPFPYSMYAISTSLQPRITEPAFVTDFSQMPETLSYKRLRKEDQSYQSGAFLAVVRKPGKKISDGFQVGTTGSVFGHNFQRSRLGYQTRYGSREEILRLIQLAGGNVHRCWDGAIAIWSIVEPEKGKFNWDLTDLQVETREKTGVELICVIGGMFTNSPQIYPPEWARKRDRSGNPNGELLSQDFYLAKRRKNLRSFRPDLKDWREYVSAVATRYKGRIKYYELTNEPNLYLKANDYMEYMKAASEEIRKADPTAKILGICSTSDMGADIEDFLGQCLKSDADQIIDGITIHPYSVLDNSTPVTQMEARRKTLANMKKLSVKARLWNGENYYPNPAWMPRTDYSGRVRPEYIARHLIVDMGEGCEGAVPTHFETFCSNWGKPFFVKHDPIDSRRYPDARYVAHSAAAYFLAGAFPIANYRFADQTLAYTFQKDGRIYTAIWNSVSPQPVTFKLPEVEAAVYDVMGNLLPGNNELQLDEKPYYIEWGCLVSPADLDVFFKKQER